MRAILMSVMLIITAVLIYSAVAGGEGGTNALLERSGRAMGDSIRRMSP